MADKEGSGPVIATVLPQYVSNRQGKDYVLYAGLLDLAHRVGLKSIRTELLQAPTGANGYLAICFAEVALEDGPVCTGIGDASPENVGRMIAPHITRMAETRAKGRALRDALNVTGEMYEDGFDAAADPGAEAGGEAGAEAPTPDPITDWQREKIAAGSALLGRALPPNIDRMHVEEAAVYLRELTAEVKRKGLVKQ